MRKCLHGPLARREQGVMSKLPQSPMTLLRYLNEQKRLALRQAQSSAFTRSGISIDAEDVALVAGSFTVGNAGVRAQGDNTAFGADAQQYLTTGYGDTAVGARAQSLLTTGTHNTAVGLSAQEDLTTGYLDTAVGVFAQRNLTTGFQDTAVGSQAQQSLTTGFQDTAVGLSAQFRLTTGDSDTAVGAYAQFGLTTGTHNTAVGSYAQGQPLGTSTNATTTASYQTSVGPETGQSSATQVDGITTVGYRATAGAVDATSIGREARADHAGSIALGDHTLTTQVNQVMVGPRDVEITSATKGIVLVAPNGTRWRLTVSNVGALVIAAA